MRHVHPGDAYRDVTDIIGEDQLDYVPIPAMRVSARFPTVDPFDSLVRITFTPDERARIAKGEDICLVFRHRVWPHYASLIGEQLPELKVHVGQHDENDE